MPGILVKGRCAVENRIVRQAHILRHEVALERRNVLQDLTVLVGEFPVSGHDIHAETITRADHIPSPGPEGGTGALPGITAVEQQRISAARFAAQAFDQCLQMSETADFAEALRRVREVQVAERMCESRSGRYIRILEQCVPNQVRHTVACIPDTNIDVRFAKIDRQQLRMAIGEVHEACLSERWRRVQVALPRPPARDTGGRPRGDTCQRQYSQEFSTIHYGLRAT